jgi:hypothetical protein
VLEAGPAAWGWKDQCWTGALIYIDSADRTRFAVDQPSTLFSGFTGPAIAEAGRGLDRRLASLLGALGIVAGPLLRAPTLAGHRNG